MMPRQKAGVLFKGMSEQINRSNPATGGMQTEMIEVD
jgi:hypothetical protein